LQVADAARAVYAALGRKHGFLPLFVRRRCPRTDLIIVSRCTLVKKPILSSGMQKNDLPKENSVMHIACKHVFCSAKRRGERSSEDE
jgi:hypothetical protein